jgi:hypothetical protein
VIPEKVYGSQIQYHAASPGKKLEYLFGCVYLIVAI